MYEMMFDLESLDTEPSAAVLSVGAVIWETLFDPRTEELSWREHGAFLKVIELQSQFDQDRTVSQDTLMWWMEQAPEARDQAFSPVCRVYPVSVMNQLDAFLAAHADPLVIKKFWASPDSFDFPMWENLAKMYGMSAPWRYNQKYDVRTVVQEANYSAKDHQFLRTEQGVPHNPVYDCRWQIDLLTAARQKLNRRTGVAFGPRVEG